MPATLSQTSPSCPSSCSLAPTPAPWGWRSSRPAPSSPPLWAIKTKVKSGLPGWLSGGLQPGVFANRPPGEEAHQWLRHHPGHPHLLRSRHARGSRNSKTHRAKWIQGLCLPDVRHFPLVVYTLVLIIKADIFSDSSMWQDKTKIRI